MHVKDRTVRTMHTAKQQETKWGKIRGVLHSPYLELVYQYTTFNCEGSREVFGLERCIVGEYQQEAGSRGTAVRLGG